MTPPQRQGHRLYKRDKLCSTAAIDRLFAPPAAGTHPLRAIAYPLRAVWAPHPGRNGDPLQFLVSVPKRRLRHAVDRVRVRRQVREAYRHLRPLVTALPDAPVDIAFVYIADKPTDTQRIQHAVHTLLDKITNP